MTSGTRGTEGKARTEVRTKSIRKMLQFTNMVIILATLVPFLISTLYYNITLNQYEGIIENVYGANSLSSVVQYEIYPTIWNVVSGKTDFEDNTQYDLINQIRNRLDELERNANSGENSYLIEVARNTLETLESYVDKIGDNIANDRPIRENEEILGEIRSVSDLLYDIIQQFVASEMEIAHIQNTKIQRSLDFMTFFHVVISSAIIVFLFRNYWQLNNSINKPVIRLKTMASKIAGGDLSTRVKKPEISELDELTDSLNTMAEKLGELIEQNTQKQQHIQKAEMRALQAQIAPHFMYNTLDTILSLAEDGQNEEVAKTTLALSSFFRLSLNKGRDWVTVAEEKSHVESYLAIQKIRYGAILEYAIDIEESMLGENMLKILLQPLVENAIYHGIKKNRQGGCISLTGRKEDHSLIFVVEDNGLGMKPEELSMLRENLADYDVNNPETGFGMYNVYKRIQLYYRTDDGLTVESEYRKGSKVTLRLPIIGAEITGQTIPLTEGAAQDV